MDYYFILKNARKKKGADKKISPLVKNFMWF